MAKRIFIGFMLIGTLLFANGSSDAAEIDENTSEMVEESENIITEGFSAVDDAADWGVNATIDGILLAIGSVLDEIYVMFFNAFTLSFENVKTLIIPRLFGVLLLLEISYLAVIAILQQDLPVEQMMKKVFVILIVLITVNNMNVIVEGLQYMFSSMGFIAGDSSFQGSFIEETPQGTIFQPSDILTAVRGMLSPLWTLKETIDEYKDLLLSTVFSGFMKFNFGALAEYLALVFASFLMYIVMLVLIFIISFCALNVAFWLIEFSFLMIIAMLCLPWQVFDPLKFASSGVWQALIGQAIKILCVVLIVAIAPELFNNAVFSQNLINTAQTVMETGGVPTMAIFYQIIITVLIVGAYCYFLMKAPAIAKAIVVGQPTMETMASHTVARTVASLSAGAAMLPLSGTAAILGGLGGLIGRGLGRLFQPHGNPDGNQPGNPERDTNPEKQDEPQPEPVQPDPADPQPPQPPEGGNP